MDAKTLGNQPAHPDRRLIQDRHDSYSLESEGGLTKREYFAGLAMQGILANPSPQCVTWDEEKVAFASAQHADALLAELAKEQP